MGRRQRGQRRGTREKSAELGSAQYTVGVGIGGVKERGHRHCVTGA